MTGESPSAIRLSQIELLARPHLNRYGYCAIQLPAALMATERPLAASKRMSATSSALLSNLAWSDQYGQLGWRTRTADSGAIRHELNLTAHSFETFELAHPDLRWLTESSRQTVQIASEIIDRVARSAVGTRGDDLASRLSPADDTSTLRYLWYEEGTTGSIGRLTPAHTDLGLLTVVFQDAAGGLEARSADGEWVRMPSGDHIAIVLAGQLLSFITEDRIPACQHRLPPTTEDRHGHGARYSAAYFGAPAKEFRLTAFVEDSEFETAHGFLMSRLGAPKGAASDPYRPPSD